MTGVGHLKLTPLGVEILRLARSEGAISASDVARDLIRGRNLRTAKGQVKRLHEMGFLKPIRICEFTLSDDGNRWLDNHDAIHAADAAEES